MSQPEEDCCFECHFKWEERVIRPQLPWPLQRWMDLQHVFLRVRRFPHDEVKRHAVEEERLFRPHVRPADYRKLQTDHVKLAA